MNQILVESTSSSELNNIIIGYEPTRIFLVTGKNSYEISGAKRFIDDACRSFKLVKYSEFEVNPKYEDVLKGVHLFKKSDCDLLIAIGGGSVIDTAKLINLFGRNPDLNFDRLIEGADQVKSKGLPFIAIPTTSGTGSEATHFAVVYKNNKKYSVSHKFILPNVVVLNYELTKTQNSYLSACAGLDALSQAIESYWCVNSTKESQNYSSNAIKLVIPNLGGAVNNPTDLNRKAMLMGSFLAGKAINITKTTAPHAISYPFTTFFGYPHGHAVALTLPFFMEFNHQVTAENIVDARGVSYLKSSMEKLFLICGLTNAKLVKQEMRDFIKDVGLDFDLTKRGFDFKKDLNQILKHISLERMSNNPKKVTKTDVVQALRYVSIKHN